MSPRTRAIQLNVPSSFGSETDRRFEIGVGPVQDNCDMSPRSSLDIDRVSDHNKNNSSRKQKTLLKSPLKKVSFTGSIDKIPTGTQHTDATTEETILTIKEDQEYYYDCDQEDAEHVCDDLDLIDNNNSNKSVDNDDDQITTKSPASVMTETKTTLKTSSAKSSRRRKIRWSGQVRVQEIRHLNNIPESERGAVWMSPMDYKMIKNIAKSTVLMMMAGEKIHDNDPDFCTRGLEFRTKKGNKIRAANKLRARVAVLNEQDLQREEGFHDPEFIAMASLDESFECREQAQKRGEKDSRAILTYVNDVPHEVKVVLFR